MKSPIKIDLVFEPEEWRAPTHIQRALRKWSFYPHTARSRFRGDETQNGQRNGNQNGKRKSSREMRRLQRDLERSFKILISISMTISSLISAGTGYIAINGYLDQVSVRREAHN